ncbi:DUF6542 domain-containing protein [Sphaerisporangium aureirubrum]|uniref:DUF6542 domain-containing protein n=1 Tax=Sphaerisporangium aureirubrum TaxID=1544736 RepID=A0ABW1NG52_9ACTN
MVARERTRPGVRLTARGAVTLVFVITLASELTGSITVTCATFAAACVVAVLLVQPKDLLALAVTPPLLFFLVTLISAVVAALGAPSMVQALGLGMFTDLSAAAPWLFGTSAAMLAIAWFRGLPDNITALKADLRSDRPTRPAVRPKTVPAKFAPEPEGYYEPRVYGSPRDPKDRPGVQSGP